MSRNIRNSILSFMVIVLPFFVSAQILSGPDNLKFQEHFFEALKNKAIGNYDKAIENLELCSELDPTSNAVLFELSKNHLFEKNYLEATAAVEQALKKDSNNVFMLSHLAEIYKEQRFFNKAIEIQKTILTHKPSDYEALIRLYLLSGQYKKALTYITSLEANDTLLSQRILLTKRRIATMLARNKNTNPTTTEVVEVSVSKFKETKDYKILESLLKENFTNSNFQETLEISELGLSYFPAQPYIYLMKAQALNSLNKFNEAIETLEMGIDFVIDNKTLENQFYKQFIKSYQNTNQSKKATEYQKKLSL